MPDILEYAEQGDSAYVIREMRVRSLFSPYYFEKIVLGCDKMVDHLHGAELELFVNNLLEGKRKQWIEWPRGHYKTTCFTIGLGIWFVLPYTDSDREFAVKELGIDPIEWDKRMTLHNQDYVQLFAFENITNAARKLSEIKLIFESNQLFRACFQEIAYKGDENPWSTSALRIRRKPGSRIPGEASFQAIGVSGAVQSQHYDIIWEDDIVGDAATKSITIMEDTITWHGRLNGVMNGPILGMDTWRFGISNRWGFADLNSKVMSDEPDFVFHTRAVYEYDPKTGQDQPIFPEQFSWKKIENLRTSANMNKFDWACQYLNCPIAPGDNLITTDNIHRYSIADDGQIICGCGFKTYATHLKRYMHYDPYNAKGANSTSSPAIAVVGLSTDKHTFLLDYYLMKAEYSKIYEKLIEYNDRYWPEIMTYEDVGHQNMTEFHLRQIQKAQEFKDAKHKQFRRILAVGTKGRAKELRIQDSLFPTFEHGKFAIRQKHQTFLDMIATFPHRVPGHDYDLLDALAQGGGVWKFPIDEDTEKQTKLDEEAVLAELGKPYGYHSPHVN